MTKLGRCGSAHVSWSPATMLRAALCPQPALALLGGSAVMCAGGDSHHQHCVAAFCASTRQSSPRSALAWCVTCRRTLAGVSSGCGANMPVPSAFFRASCKDMATTTQTPADRALQRPPLSLSRGTFLQASKQTPQNVPGSLAGGVSNHRPQKKPYVWRLCRQGEYFVTPAPRGCADGNAQLHDAQILGAMALTWARRVKGWCC